MGAREEFINILKCLAMITSKVKKEVYVSKHKNILLIMELLLTTDKCWHPKKLVERGNLGNELKRELEELRSWTDIVGEIELFRITIEKMNKYLYQV
jgi:hypothetical protein